jgi:membrane protein
MNAFLAMFPLILGMLAIVGLVVNDAALQSKLYEGIASVFPANAHGEILSALSGAKHSAGLLGVLSIVGLVWSGTNLFAAMEFSLTQIYGTKQRDMLRQRLMGLVMVVIFMTAVLLAIGANSLAAISPGGGLIGLVLGAVVLTSLLLLIYRWVPNRTFSFKDIWPGAVVAGILIEILSLVFPLYAKLSHGFNSYGQEFALFFLLATWLMFLSQFILLGAVFNKVRLGDARATGLFAAPESASRAIKRPAEAIKQQQREAGEAHLTRYATKDRSDIPTAAQARGFGNGRTGSGAPTRHITHPETVSDIYGGG